MGDVKEEEEDRDHMREEEDEEQERVPLQSWTMRIRACTVYKEGEEVDISGLDSM